MSLGSIVAHCVPFYAPAGSQDVMVVVQCSTQPQLQTLPPATPASADTIKAFADSITRKTSGKLANVYRRLSGSSGGPSEVDARTLKQWRNQTAMMWVWLMSSLMVVMFVPTFVAPGALLLASLTASALGIIAVVMHCMGDRLAETGETKQQQPWLWEPTVWLTGSANFV